MNIYLLYLQNISGIQFILPTLIATTLSKLSSSLKRVAETGTKWVTASVLPPHLFVMNLIRAVFLKR